MHYAPPPSESRGQSAQRAAPAEKKVKLVKIAGLVRAISCFTSGAVQGVCVCVCVCVRVRV